jgi:hypothetical protein
MSIWIRSALEVSGVDISVFKKLSTRGTTASKAYAVVISTDKILRAGLRKSESTLLIIPHIFRAIQSSETEHLETFIIVYDNRDVFSVSQIVSNNHRFGKYKIKISLVIEHGSPKSQSDADMMFYLSI